VGANEVGGEIHAEGLTIRFAACDRAKRIAFFRHASARNTALEIIEKSRSQARVALAERALDVTERPKLFGQRTFG